MAGDIGPGDVVVCILSDESTPHLTEGSTYVVTGIFDQGALVFDLATLRHVTLDVPCVMLAELPNYLFALDRFAKGHKPGAFPSTVVVDDRERVDA